METLEKAAQKCAYDTGEGYENPNFNQAVECFVKGFVFGFENGAKHTKEEYEEKLRWIPVEENLPERDKNVLIKRSAPFHKYELTAFNRDGIFYSNETGEILNKVTHWCYFLN